MAPCRRDPLGRHREGFGRGHEGRLVAHDVVEEAGEKSGVPGAGPQGVGGHAGGIEEGIETLVVGRHPGQDRERKSFGSERTFLRDLRERADLVEALRDILESVWSDRERTGRMGRTVTLKMKYSDFRLISRSKTDHVAICDRAWLDATATGLLDGLLPVHKGVRLIGVSVSNLVEADRCMSGQMPLL